MYWKRGNKWKIKWNNGNWNWDDSDWILYSIQPYRIRPRLSLSFPNESAWMFYSTYTKYFNLISVYAKRIEEWKISKSNAVNWKFDDANEHCHFVTQKSPSEKIKFESKVLSLYFIEGLDWYMAWSEWCWVFGSDVMWPWFWRIHRIKMFDFTFSEFWLNAEWMSIVYLYCK